MTLVRNPGRVAGLWYLLLIVIGPFFLLYVPNKVFVEDNASATVNNLAAHELLFRFGIVAELAGAIILILLTLAFYRLFAGVDRNLAVLVVILGGVMPAVLYFVGVGCELAALRIVRGANFLSAFDKPQQDALALLFLRLHGSQITASLALAGAWLFPLAMLVYRSRFLPRFLGVWVAIGGIAYLALSVTAVLWPQYQDKVFSYSQPAFFGEIALTLWLVIKGARPPAPDASVS
jgi:hypothetical protein